MKKPKRYDYIGNAINAAHHAFPKKVTVTRAILRKLVREAVLKAKDSDGHPRRAVLPTVSRKS